MGLLDEDNEIMKKVESKKKSRKAKSSGVNRFASLNRYSKVTKELKAKNKESTKTNDTKVSTTNKTKKLVDKKPETIELKKQLQRDTFISLDNTLKSTPEENLSPEKEPETSQFKSTQEVSKESTKRVQETSKESTENNDQSTNWKTIKSTTRVQNRVHSDVPEVRCLSGQNKKLLNIFFNDCKSSGSLFTGKFTNELLCELMSVKPSTLKTIIYRLNNKNFINRHQSKSGRGGWMSFQIPQTIFGQLIDLEKHETNLGNHNHWSTNKTTDRSTNQSTNYSSSSSYYVNNRDNETKEKTTTKEFNSLPESWLNIEIPDVCKDFSFSKTHLKQIYHSKANSLTHEDVQDSLEHFSYDLLNNNVSPHKGPLGFILGILRGNEGRNGKSPREGTSYYSPQFLKHEEAEINRRKEIVKRRNEELSKRAELELSEEAFKFISTLKEEDKKAFLKPKEGIFGLGSASYERMLLQVIKDRIKSDKTLNIDEVKKEFLHF